MWLRQRTCVINLQDKDCLPTRDNRHAHVFFVWRVHYRVLLRIISLIHTLFHPLQIVSDESLDPNALQIEKEEVKTVQFNPEEDFVPLFEWEQGEVLSGGSSGSGEVPEGEPSTGGTEEGAQGSVEGGGAAAPKGE